MFVVKWSLADENQDGYIAPSEKQVFSRSQFSASVPELLKAWLTVSLLHLTRFSLPRAFYKRLQIPLCTALLTHPYVPVVRCHHLIDTVSWIAPHATSTRILIV
jgi:hypothetical protein